MEKAEEDTFEGEVEIDNLVDKDVLPRYKIICRKINWYICVSTNMPENICPICFEEISKIDPCITVKLMIRQHTVDTGGRPQGKSGPHFSGAPKPRDYWYKKARKDYLARQKNPSMRIND